MRLHNPPVPAFLYFKVALQSAIMQAPACAVVNHVDIYMCLQDPTVGDATRGGLHNICFTLALCKYIATHRRWRLTPCSNREADAGLGAFASIFHHVYLCGSPRPVKVTVNKKKSSEAGKRREGRGGEGRMQAITMRDPIHVTSGSHLDCLIETTSIMIIIMILDGREDIGPLPGLG